MISTQSKCAARVYGGVVTREVGSCSSVVWALEALGVLPDLGAGRAAVLALGCLWSFVCIKTCIKQPVAQDAHWGPITSHTGASPRCN